jgi:hypothetical protein
VGRTNVLDATTSPPALTNGTDVGRHRSPVAAALLPGTLPSAPTPAVAGIGKVMAPDGMADKDADVVYKLLLDWGRVRVARAVWDDVVTLVVLAKGCRGGCGANEVTDRTWSWGDVTIDADTACDDKTLNMGALKVGVGVRRRSDQVVTGFGGKGCATTLTGEEATVAKGGGSGATVATGSDAEAVSTSGARGAAKRDADSTRGGAVGKTRRGTREGLVGTTTVVMVGTGAKARAGTGAGTGAGVGTDAGTGVEANANAMWRGEPATEAGTENGSDLLTAVAVDERVGETGDSLPAPVTSA